MESAYTAIGDKIYIIAGYGETGKRNKNSVEVYDTKTDTWTTAAPVPVNLNSCSCGSFLMVKSTLLGATWTIKFHQTNCSYTILPLMHGKKESDADC